MNTVDKTTLLQIFDYLYIKDTVIFGNVNHFIHMISNDLSLWENIGLKMNLQPPKLNARKYKTWKSLVLKQSYMFCTHCYGNIGKIRKIDRRLCDKCNHNSLYKMICKAIVKKNTYSKIYI